MKLRDLYKVITTDRVVEVHNFMQEHLRGSHSNIKNGLKPLNFKIQILL